MGVACLRKPPPTQARVVEKPGDPCRGSGRCRSEEPSAGCDARHAIPAFNHDHWREASHIAERPPEVLADLMREPRARPGRRHLAADGDVEPRAPGSREPQPRPRPLHLPVHGRFAIMSISTSAPTASAVTPTVVRAGRLSAGK